MKSFKIMYFNQLVIGVIRFMSVICLDYIYVNNRSKNFVDVLVLNYVFFRLFVDFCGVEIF